MSFDLQIKDGDLQIGANSDLVQVIDGEKLTQDLLKMALTPVGSNPFFPWFGSSISKNLIGTPFNLGIVGPLATDQLRSSLETLQKLQRLQMNSGQRVSPFELLAAVQQVKIERNVTDPRFFRVVIRVLSKALVSTTTSFDVSL